MRTFAWFFAFCCLAVVCSAKKNKQPNLILFLADDVGWGDFPSFGHPTQEPGAVDRMAEEGMRFTQWYSANSVCSPSRGALMTGRLAFRTGIYGNSVVFFQNTTGGLPLSEVTIAETLKTVGYKTGMVGKWHLGINEATRDDGKFLPHAHGFDYVGTILPLSLSTGCDTIKRHLAQPDATMCFLYKNTTIIEQPINLESMTEKLVADAKKFIRDNRDGPFFFFFGLPQSHTPMFNNPIFNGSSSRGVYGDQINEMNWAIEQILDQLVDLRIDDDTLAIFTSDNGPHKEICEEGGSAGPFKEGKLYYGEGGFRVPAVAWWPRRIVPGQVSTSVINTMDIYPTFAELAGATLRSDIHIDGKSFASLLQRAPNSPPVIRDDLQFFYCANTQHNLVAVRYQQYKIYFYKTKYPTSDFLKTLCRNGFPLLDYFTIQCPTEAERLTEWLIFDLEDDPSEDWPINVATLPTVVQKVNLLLTEHQNSIVPDVGPLVSFAKMNNALNPCCNPPACRCNYIEK